MFRSLVVVISLLLGACSSLDSDSDFSQSVETVDYKGGQTRVVGKTYTPETISSNGGDIVKSQVVVVLNSKNSQPNELAGFVNMEVTYFKSYNEFEKASYLGRTVDLIPIKPSTSTCSEHCTTSQYFSFPIDKAAVDSIDRGDFEFELITNSRYEVTFTIASGYMKALRNEMESQTQNTGILASRVIVNDNQSTSKSLEMIQYWYERSTDQDREKFIDWAVQNRKNGNAEETFTSQPAQMMQYWYNTGSKEERQQVLGWVLSL
ncbi:hypothetical protein VTH8203_00956 [Vibrio thalassae]|uniref:DUF2057 domain-containing protein n=1 Tax=Vibrio thalassae TaxID=1243014 RepID=A0A240EHA6_9VIBR|nr:DUF2057 domain-containing protein [Vibrio thalassae]SNX47355.1 hypothetical protein VTH8203_00956 [Vibrio thalassae]